MKSFFSRIAALAAWLGALAAASTGAFAQPIQNAVFTLGTTATDSHSNAWGYVVLQPTDPSSIKLRTLAIYTKPGPPSSATPYTRQSVVSLQTDPLTIQALINRAVPLGEDLAQLDTRINNLFAGVIPATNLTLAQKLSIVIRGSVDSPQDFGSLVLLGRLHPAVNLCLGFGYAQMLTNGPLTTFEVRDYDASNHVDRGVFGRVTITNGVPLVLPPPGLPVNVPKQGGMGQLNARFRWATPPELRQVALLSAGFDLFRVPRAVAEASGYTNTPPTTKQILGNPAAVRVNTQPIFKNHDYDTDLEAGDLGSDPSTFFIADDNGLAQARPPAVPVRFNNGDQFYYYLAARDLLGRDGRLSLGILVTICDRVPSDAPKMPKVVNDYKYVAPNEIQTLKVSWGPVTNLPSGKHIVGYYVYRWANPDEVMQNASNTNSHRISPLIPTVSGATNYSYLDNGLGSPQAPADYGNTFWYTIRAVDDGACDGGNYSPNSAPSFGVLRNRNGPGAPGGGPDINCCRPDVIGGKPLQKQFPKGSLDNTYAYFDLICVRADTQIEWAEFSFGIIGRSTNFIGRFHFMPNQDVLVVPVFYPTALFANNPSQVVFCRAGATDGDISQVAQVYSESRPIPDTRREFPFEALSVCQDINPDQFNVTGTFAQLPCRHSGQTPGPSGTVGTNNGVVIHITLTPGTKEYKLYRRVDSGPLTLIQEGLGDYATVTNLVAHDTDLPANSATICYYCQLFDENGNASPLAQIGSCIQVQMPTPTPLLSPLFSLGDPLHPKMGIRWFCPPVGVQRFEVLVAVSQGNPPVNFSDVLGADTASHPNYVHLDSSGTNIADFAVYPTPGPGLDFGPGPEFDLQVPIILGTKYTVQIRAISVAGAEGPGSHFESFKWAPPPAATGPAVPWPQRPLPGPGNTPPLLYAQQLTNGMYEGVVVNIGRVLRTQYACCSTNKLVSYLQPNVKTSDIVTTNMDGKSILPFAVYRYQKANLLFPSVSGDIIQVSPLIDQLAMVPGTNSQTGPYQALADPFVLAPQGAQVGTVPEGGGPLWLLDTQPVVRGATYEYLVVRFGDDGEPVEIIPTPAVDILP